MKKTITAALILLSFSGFSQALPKTDSVKLTFDFRDLQLIYAAVDNTHGDHMDVKRILEYITTEYNKQTKKDSANKK